MTSANSFSDYHTRFCLARDWRASLFCVLFSGWEVLVRWIGVGKPFPIDHKPFQIVVSVFGVVALTVYQMVRLKCLRERIVFGVAAVGFAFYAARLLSPSVASWQTLAIKVALLSIWVLALGLSISLFWSATRQSVGQSPGK